MKKFFAMAAIAALTMAGMSSCSNDDEIVQGVSQYGKAEQSVIAYDVTQDGAIATRGIATTAANYLQRITSFQVFAYDNSGTNGRYVGTTDVVGTIINGDGNGNWAYDDEKKTQYWPRFSLDFQAVTPATDASFTLANTVVSGSPRLTADVVIPTDVKKQKDIMFAAATNVNNAQTGQPVKLTFRHALTQVVFAGKVAKPTIKAEVKRIELVNIHNTGNVGYRAAVSTLSALQTNNAASTFAVGLTENAEIPSTATDNAVNITADDGALMMIPQTVAKWTTTKQLDGTGTAVPVTTADAAHNSYLKIQCAVTDTNSNQKLIDTDTDVYIPFEVAWEQGKKYTYTLIFGNGAGGYDEDGNPLTNMIPITYTVETAEDWTPADGGSIAF